MKRQCEDCHGCNCIEGLCEIERILRRPPPLFGPIEKTLLASIVLLGLFALMAMAHALPSDCLS